MKNYKNNEITHLLITLALGFLFGFVCIFVFKLSSTTIVIIGIIITIIGYLPEILNLIAKRK